MSSKTRSGITEQFRAPARGVLLALALSAMVIACNAGVDSEGLEEEGATEEMSSELLASRTYVCGYALPGYSCNNGRSSKFIVAADLTSALSTCRAVQPPAYSDFCYVRDNDGAIPEDVTQCAAAAGSWRAGNSCCNFRGTLSCPSRTYVCGYALPGYNCDNGRSSKFVVATDLASALRACPSLQPPSYTDFCYVRDDQGEAPSDVFQCAAVGGSWRVGNACCNFKGSLSCP